jgi:hypothetical protein
MTSVDADLRSGRRLETGRRSESIIYIFSFADSMEVTGLILA